MYATRFFISNQQNFGLQKKQTYYIARENFLNARRFDLTVI